MAERGTDRPTEAEVRGLMERIKPSVVLGPAEKRELIAICEDWLRLNRAERRIEMANPQITKQNWEPPHA